MNGTPIPSRAMDDLMMFRLTDYFPHRVLVRQPVGDDAAWADITAWLKERNLILHVDYLVSDLFWADKNTVELAYGFCNKATAATFKLTWG